MDNELDQLEPHELVQLAMMAFLHMYDKHTIPKDKLLEDIITWFRIMTDVISEIEVHQVMPLNDTNH